MFILNRTPHKISLIRGHISDTMAVAAVVAEVVYAIQADGRLLATREREELPSDPPSAAKYPIWAEVSLTVSGSIACPARPPYTRRLGLRAGDRHLELLVHGDRRWRRGVSGALEAGEPQRFDRMALGFERAFGGSFVQAPGPDPLSGLPHPGGKIAYPLNPEGIGFYGDEISAENGLLANIEWADRPVLSWDDRPEPAGFSPCPSLHGLRFPMDTLMKLPFPKDPELAQKALSSFPMTMLASLRMPHFAHKRLIFRESELKPGTPIELKGMASGAMPIAFLLPPPPVEVFEADSRDSDLKSSPALRPNLRNLHIDADGRYLLATYGYMTRYRPSFGPEWFHVNPLAAEV